MSEFKTNKISPRKGTTQTIGDSGDTVSIASGVTVTNAGTITTAGISGGTINNTSGTISGLQGVIEWDTTAKTTAFTAEANKGYFCNTTSATFTVTFPASPSAGDVIGIKDYANTFDTNKISIAPNGNKIQGSTATFESTDEGAALQFIYVDATRGWVLTDASKASDIAEAATFITATGGCITTCGDFKIHTFTGPGTFCVSSIGNPVGGPNNVDYLVVAGGGGGASVGGGGGGAGGFRESSGTNTGCYSASPLGACVPGITVTASTYPITVGAGGVGGPIGPTEPETRGSNGSNSVFSTITSTGGGAGYQPGGCGSATTYTGGSGGGGNPDNSSGTAGAGNTPPTSPSQGNPGGNGTTQPGTGYRRAGGGGGAGGAGQAASGPKGGDGGVGVPTSISGSALSYSGGGGGGITFTPSGSPGGASPCGTGGAGGTGGSSPGADAGAGTINRGGGGGGASSPATPGGVAGAGGSGIVIIRYKYQ
jgi:hypothetical protein